MTESTDRALRRWMLGLGEIGQAVQSGALAPGDWHAAWYRPART